MHRDKTSDTPLVGCQHASRQCWFPVRISRSGAPLEASWQKVRVIKRFTESLIDRHDHLADDDTPVPIAPCVLGRAADPNWNLQNFLLERNGSACYRPRFWQSNNSANFIRKRRRESVRNGSQENWKRATKTRPEKAEDAEQDSPPQVTRLITVAARRA